MFIFITVFLWGCSEEMGGSKLEDIVVESRDTSSHNDTGQDALEPSEPAAEPAQPSSEPAQPSSEPSEPSSEPSEPASEPSEPSSEPSEPASEPSEPASEPSEPASEPSQEQHGYNLCGMGRYEAKPAGTLSDPIHPTYFPIVDEDNTTMSASNAIDYYDCAPSTNESGPEIVYAFTADTPGDFKAWLIDPSGVDIDLHLL